MTVCIAAICENGKNLVVAADRMFTMQAPLNLEFEPPISKVERLTPNCVVLEAGNSLSAQEVTNRTRSKLAAGAPAPTNMIAGHLKSEYETFRDEAIEENLIRAAARMTVSRELLRANGEKREVFSVQVR